MSNFEDQLIEALGSAGEPVNPARIEVRFTGKRGCCILSSGVAQLTFLKVAATAPLVERGFAITVEAVINPAQFEVGFRKTGVSVLCCTAFFLRLMP